MVSVLGFFTFILFYFIFTNQNIDESVNQSVPPISPLTVEEPPNSTQASSSTPSRLPERRPDHLNLAPPILWRRRNLTSHVFEEAASSSRENYEFLNLAPLHPHHTDSPDLVPEPHRMDALSWVALGYCFMTGIEFNGIYSQVKDPLENITPRFTIIAVFNMLALCLLIAANGKFARARPRLAFYMDRLGSSLVLASSVIAANSIMPLPVSFVCLGILIIVYFLQCVNYLF